MGGRAKGCAEHFFWLAGDLGLWPVCAGWQPQGAKLSAGDGLPDIGVDVETNAGDLAVCVPAARLLAAGAGSGFWCSSSGCPGIGRAARDVHASAARKTSFPGSGAGLLRDHFSDPTPRLRRDLGRLFYDFRALVQRAGILCPLSRQNDLAG